VQKKRRRTCLVFINLAVLIIICAPREFWRGTAGAKRCAEVDGVGWAGGRAREEAEDEDSKRACAHAVPPANQPLPQLGISSAISENLIWATCI